MIAPTQRPLPTEESSWDQKEMPFVEHLRELRYRLLISIAAVGGIALLLVYPSQFVIRWLVGAYFHGIRLHAFGPADVLMTELKFSIIGAIVLGLPILIFQLWMFVVPAVHPHTRRMVYAFVAPSLLLSGLGVAFAHFLVIPRVVAALVATTEGVAIPTFGVAQTLNFVVILLALFAIIFQTPILMLALARIGIINVSMLRTYRRYAFLVFFVLGAFAAPDGNPLTMTLLAIPMYLLYEVGIIAIAVLGKSWRKPGASL